MKKCLGWHFECCARRVPTLRKSAAHRIKKRTLHYKKCVLLRLPFLFRLLHLALFHREKTEKRPRERHHNSQTTKRLFLNTTFPKRLTKLLKKFPSFLKQLSSCTSFAFLRTSLCPLLCDNAQRLFVNQSPISMGYSCLSTLNYKLSTQKFAHLQIFHYFCTRNDSRWGMWAGLCLPFALATIFQDIIKGVYWRLFWQLEIQQITNPETRER